MPYRTFADDQGKNWEVWDVRPDHVERRDVERRAERPEPWTGLERRVSSDRRQLPESRARLTGSLAAGWLVFKSDDEKRRLAPIPPGWESFRGQDLRALCTEAHVIAGRIDDQRSA
ncbi:MAG TPA: hypothetical protein VMY38_08370 [Gemmatimonadaceae bacterium]|nr:hypothetical protein [Gemmatimonadaceae bacterium]